MPGDMTTILNPFPPADPVTTLGALLGPVGLLALVATLVALGVILIGLIVERREAVRRLRGVRAGVGMPSRPTGAPPERHAA
jgi:hypothetical protein